MTSDSKRDYKYDNKLVISSGKIIGDFIGVRNANGDVLDISSKRHVCKIYPNDIGRVMNELMTQVNGEAIIQYKGLNIPTAKIEQLGDALQEAEKYIGKTLHRILIR